MEDGRDADARTEMAGVGGDREHGLRRCPEQQVIDHSLVVESDIGEFGRDGEDDMEIADRQQVGLTGGEPLVRRGSLTLGTVPVAATVIGDADMAAVLAAFDMTAEGRRYGRSRSPTSPSTGAG